MDKTELIRLRNEIGSLPALADGDAFGDNIGTALVQYFQEHNRRPKNDEVNDEIGWGQWAIDKTNDALDRIVQHLSKPERSVNA